MIWKRYHFYTHSINDYRPLISNPRFPWWCIEHIGTPGGEIVAIIAYLPEDEDLLKYWNDAFGIGFTLEEEILFTDSFPKPDWYNDFEILGDSHIDDLITDVIWLRDEHLHQKGAEPDKDEAYAYNLCDRILDKLRGQ